MKNTIICYCASITENEIKEAVISGASNIREVREFLSKFESGDCENKNPSGRCCHKLFSNIIKLHKGTITILEPYSDLYNKSLDFRSRLLYKPINKTLKKDSPHEGREKYIGFVVNGAVLGCLVLTKIDDEVIQIRQVAVDYSVQGLNLGRKLMEYAENIIQKQNFSKITISARSSVLNFYTKLGYTVEGDEYISPNSQIPHFKVYKELITPQNR